MRFDAIPVWFTLFFSAYQRGVPIFVECSSKSGRIHRKKKKTKVFVEVGKRVCLFKFFS